MATTVPLLLFYEAYCSWTDQRAGEPVLDSTGLQGRDLLCLRYSVPCCPHLQSDGFELGVEIYSPVTGATLRFEV